MVPAGIDAIDFLLALGRALHRYGTPAHRLEDAMVVMGRRLDLEVEVFSTPTALIMSFGAPAELRTRMMRVDSGELDMDKLEQVDDLADDVAAQKLTPAEGVRRLEQILASPRLFGRALSTVMHGVTSGGMAVFFGGGAVDVAVAAAIGLTLGLLAQVAKRSTDQARVFELVGAAFVAFAAAAMSSVVSITPSLVTVAALIVLLPGMSLTVAMTDLATRHLIAGTARLMSAVIVLLELVVGVALGERLAVALVDVEQAIPIPLPAWSQWIALVATAIAIAIVVQAQLRAFVWIVAACAGGYAGNRLGATWLDAQMGVLVGAFAVGVLANVFARLMERPAQVVLVPAVLLLVPGSMGFRGMTSLLGHDTLTGVETVFAMFVVAFALVAGLLIANAVVSPRRSL
ncbi:MAG: threonine/serine exporter family protein [Deltaproteobacteria bacterium]|nr:threonine/serine exporter family protein [Deltaproteobacteria bacterium]MDQ3295588.1 threonine/serine exporter family protein [Myxococcota bacterium]